MQLTHFRYQCPSCMSKDEWRDVNCLARDDDGELKFWMEEVMSNAVACDHVKNSPLCFHDRFNMMFPVPGESEEVWIGKANEGFKPSG